MKTEYLMTFLIIVILYNIFAAKEGFSNRYKVNPKKRKVLVLYTGGTIGMMETPQGFSPKKGYLEKQLKKILNLNPHYQNQISPYHIKEYDPLLDSSNMTPKDWNKMIKDIHNHYYEYSAFVIIHGTDTMSYSASALSFALENLTKPVIFTGSMIPLAKLRNDGINNLIRALVLASNYTIPEVLLVFSNKIMRGNRSVKINGNKLNAFDTPNFPILGGFGYEQMPIFRYQYTPTWSRTNAPFTISLYNTNYEVYIFFLTPGANFKTMHDIVNNNPQIKGVILLTFGIGDGPVANPEFMNMLRFLHSHQIYTINVSQCIEGRVDQGDYQTGTALAKAHVISGKDMTIEAVYTKLLYLLSKYGSGDEIIIKTEMEKDLEGELSHQLVVKDIS